MPRSNDHQYYTKTVQAAPKDQDVARYGSGTKATKLPAERTGGEVGAHLVEAEQPLDLLGLSVVDQDFDQDGVDHDHENGEKQTHEENVATQWRSKSYDEQKQGTREEEESNGSDDWGSSTDEDDTPQVPITYWNRPTFESRKVVLEQWLEQPFFSPTSSSFQQVTDNFVFKTMKQARLWDDGVPLSAVLYRKV